MAKIVNMSNILPFLFLALNLISFLVTANVNEQNNNLIFEKVLKHLNEENNAKYSFESSRIIETHILNTEIHFLADLATTCEETEETPCVPLSLICQGVLEDNNLSKIKCFLKEDTPALPNYDQGFILKRSNKFIESIFDHGIQKLARDGEPQRKLIEVLAVKKRETSGTEIYITAKVSAGSEENGDVLELEVCEVSAILGTAGSMKVLESEAKCFPVTEESEIDHLGGTLLTPDELSDLAQWSMNKINMFTSVVFNYSLIEIIKADASVTPGSDGVLTTMQLRLASSFCPKHNFDPEVIWDCDSTGQPIICTLSTWQRPWRGDRLLSRPRCKRIPIPKSTTTRVLRHTGSDDSAEKRPAFCAGCLEEVNKENSQVTELATMALKQLNEGKFSTTPHKLLRVLSAHRQVINGVRYVLNVELLSCPEGTCEVTENTVASLKCELEIIEGAVDQERKLTSSECQSADQTRENIQESTTSMVDVTPEESKNADLVQSQVTEKSEDAQPSSNADALENSRRDKRADKPLGSPVQVNLQEEGALINELAQMALSKIDDIDDDLSRRKLLQVVSAKKQNINGIIYQISMRVGVMPPCGEECMTDQLLPSLLCQVWVHRSAVTTSSPQPQSRVMRSECEPEGSVEIQEAPERPSLTVTNPNDTKQKRSIKGGRYPVDSNDPYIQELAQYAVSELDKVSEKQNSRLMVRIVSAERQIVEGTLNHLTMEIGASNCSKGSSTSSVCNLQENQEIEICTVSVWDRPWIKLRSVQNFSCQPKETNRVKRSARLGGKRPADVNDPYIQEIASFSVQELDRGSNSLYTRQVVNVISAEKQIVSGTLTHLTLELGYSNCSKGSLHNEVCSVQKNQARELCTVAVWDKPWLKERSIQESSCSEITTDRRRSKRSVNLLGRGTHDLHIGMFRKFMTRYGKKYDSDEEYRRRFHIFRANLRKIKLLQKAEQGTAKYGPTQFADLSVKEFKQQYLGLRVDLQKQGKMKMQQAVVPNFTLPDEIDWRHFNVVTPVKNQGACGSCWAFSVTGNIEGQWALRRGQLLSLSEQELVDCDSLDSGCNGGLPSNAYEAIKNLGGLETEADYPYDGQDEKCHFNKSEVKVTVTGAVNITKDENTMAQWLAKYGPISIGINANAMQFYFGGVSHPWKMLCNPNDLDHGVLIVGYGVHTYPLFNKTLPYWTIKNSWGPKWGEQGYYRVYRGDGTCGVNQMATTAIVG